MKGHLKRNVALLLLLGVVAVEGFGCRSTRYQGGEPQIFVPKPRVTEISLGKVDGTFVESLAVSPDSRRVAFAVRRGEKTVLVVDGKEKENTYDKVANLVFSPDSRRLVYLAKRGGKWFIVANGTEGKEYDGFGQPGPVFGPDSKHVSFLARRGKKWMVVVSGKETGSYETFLRGSRLVFDSLNRLHALMVRNGEILLVEIETED